MSDEMTMVFPENIINEDHKVMAHRAAAHALSHLFKRENTNDLTGTMNIIHCLSDHTLSNMAGQLDLMTELVHNEMSRRG